jgi:AcrR family transcriptional regulator
MNRSTEKRHLIMQAAENLFTSRRFHEITMEDVAAAADVAKGTIYLYFHDKEDLFFQTATNGFDELCELIQANVPGDAPFPEQLLAACRNIREFYTRRRPLMRMIQAEESRLQFSSGGMYDRWMEKRTRLVSAVAAILSKGVAARHIRGDVPVEVLAALLMGMLRAQARDFPEVPDRLKDCEFVVEVFQRGAAPEPPGAL